MGQLARVLSLFASISGKLIFLFTHRITERVTSFFR